MGVRSNGLRNGCVSVCVSVYECVLPLSPPLLEVNMRLKMWAKVREGAQIDERMNKWVFFFFHPTPSPAALPLCVAVTLSPPLSPLLTPSSHLPPRSLLTPHHHHHLFWRLHFASAAAEQAAIAQRGGQTLLVLCLISFMPFHSLALFFPMIYLSFIHRGSSQEIRGGKKIYFSTEILSVCAVHTASLPSPSLCEDQALCSAEI